ncbi:Sec-independent protein translocase subunit TatA/TatB [Pedobacter insulae]|uniref:Sec-independent protein translocase protein TatA n=1 Tax=Pedobacter insulae TaxID=414048 RepID=A0A1I2YXW1_9SPHI|nr:twin-arginine translocase TatA/TatE family subunit [Pedobacter insulae]SFH30452.1 sec-independent protein translocase protein TatA [Pedobacter insulae]
MTQPTILVGLGTPEIILIVLALLLLFGGKKIPELMRGLGKGVKEFKDGKDGLDSDTKSTTTTTNDKPL